MIGITGYETRMYTIQVDRVANLVAETDFPLCKKPEEFRTRSRGREVIEIRGVSVGAAKSCCNSIAQLGVVSIRGSQMAGLDPSRREKNVMVHGR